MWMVLAAFCNKQFSLRVFSNIIKPGHFTVASGLELEIALWLELAAYIDVV
jgi:hypothetical protein